MHSKDIKATVRKQLKKQYPNWQRLTKKEKKVIAKAVLAEAVAQHDHQQPVQASFEELVGIENQIASSGIMTLEEMGRFIANHRNSRLFNLSEKQGKLFGDPELNFINSLIDDGIINRLLAYDGFSPRKRDFMPSQMLRAELLKSIKYPEISYRKYCSKDYMGMDQKLNRAFIGLPLNKNQTLSHVQLCQFRQSLTFTQMMNLQVYFLHHFSHSDLLGGCHLHGIDSTELALDTQTLLATVEVEGKKIRIYDDIDSDCGTRRNKRDKSIYVVGYRMHTLTAIDAETSHCFPLISLLAPANHHDSHFYHPLVQLGQAIGLDLKLVTADEAYHDKNDVVYQKTGVRLVTPPRGTSVPKNFEKDTLQVMYDDLCEVPMAYIGFDGDQHEFKCAADLGECFRESICPKRRQIPLDTGYFQRILHDSDLVYKAIDIRKNSERPFNLMKNREGLKTVRVRSRQGVLARCTFTHMATLLLELAGTRRKKKKSKKYQELPFSKKAA